jgi:hypothetical protein
LYHATWEDTRGRKKPETASSKSISTWVSLAVNKWRCLTSVTYSFPLQTCHPLILKLWYHRSRSER